MSGVSKTGGGCSYPIQCPGLEPPLRSNRSGTTTGSRSSSTTSSSSSSTSLHSSRSSSSCPSRVQNRSNGLI